MVSPRRASGARSSPAGQTKSRASPLSSASSDGKDAATALPAQSSMWVFSLPPNISPRRATAFWNSALCSATYGSREVAPLPSISRSTEAPGSMPPNFWTGPPDGTTQTWLIFDAVRLATVTVV